MSRLGTRILLTCAAIGVAGGIVGVANTILFVIISGAVPWLLGIAAGFYVIAGVIALAVIRRPGVGLLTSVFVGLIQIPFSPGGASVLLNLVILGVVLELPYLVTRYRIWTRGLAYVGPTVLGLLWGAWWWLWLAELQLPIGLQVACVVITVASMVFCTWIALLVAAGLERTGVVRGLAPRRASDAEAAPTAEPEPAV